MFKQNLIYTTQNHTNIQDPTLSAHFEN